MDKIISQLQKIEDAAETVLSSTDKKKKEISDRYVSMQEQFDKNLDNDINNQIRDMKDKSKAEIDATISNEENSYKAYADKLKADFDINKDRYADELMRKVIE